MFGKFVTGKLNRVFGKGKKAIVAAGLAVGLLAAAACQGAAQTVEVEVTREIPITRVYEVTREVPVTREVEVTRQVEVSRNVEATREVPVTRQVEVTREVPVTRMVEIPVTRLVEVTREVEVTRQVPVNRLVTATPQPTPTPPADWNALKATAKMVSYDDLFRYNEEWIGELVYYKGEVVQVIERGDDNYNLRINVTEDQYGWWDDTVFLYYSGERLLEDDIIEFVGEVYGLLTYEAVMGNEVTIPEIGIIQSRRIP